MSKRVLVALGLSCVVGWAGVAGAQDESPLGYIEMPEAPNGEWVLASPTGSGHNWGTPVFVRYLAMVATEWHRRHPEGPVVRIGDMSKPDGTEFPPHKTHRDGLTVDITTRPANACHVDYDDQSLTLELAQLFHDMGARQILYNGELVTEGVSVAQAYPRHDDHFHVVIDPARVPDEGQVLVLPASWLKDGETVGASAWGEDGLRLVWRVLGSVRLDHMRVQFDDMDPREVLHDSGEVRLGQPVYEVPVALEDGARYRWRVELVPTEGERLELPWQEVVVDRVAPRVAGVSPEEGAELSANPVLTWSYDKPGATQAEYWIEFDDDSRHRRIEATFGPFEGSARRYALGSNVRLRRGRTYYWRVCVRDAHGNVGESEWSEFETSRDYDPDAAPEGPAEGTGRVGVVSASALNFREGPGTSHGVIRSWPEGTEVQILEEQGGWLRVVAPDGREGWVSGRYIRE